MGAFLGLAVAIWFIYHAYKASKKDNYTSGTNNIHDNDDGDNDNDDDDDGKLGRDNAWTFVN